VIRPGTSVTFSGPLLSAMLTQLAKVALAYSIARRSWQSSSLPAPLTFNEAFANDTERYTGAGLVGFALGGCGDIALTYVQDSYDGVRDSERDHLGN
jgi:hypothetical protein